MYGLALVEIEAGKKGRRGRPERRQLVRVWGGAMQSVFDRVVEAVKTSGGRASDIRWTRKEPFPLDEETGVRLGLLLLAIKPLRKTSRIETIRDETARMGSEEAYYWFAKCASSESGTRATKAFRILLAHE